MKSAFVYLGGVEFAVVQLQDLQRSLEVGLRLRQLHLDGPQAVDVRGRQVHPQQREINLQRNIQLVLLVLVCLCPLPEEGFIQSQTTLAGATEAYTQECKLSQRTMTDTNTRSSPDGHLIWNIKTDRSCLDIWEEMFRSNRLDMKLNQDDFLEDISNIWKGFKSFRDGRAGSKSQHQLSVVVRWTRNWRAVHE